jgi:hypothetical protein
MGSSPLEPGELVYHLVKCTEIRTSLTVMFATYQLVRHTADQLSRHERLHLLDRAEHHADRAESLLQETFQALEQA